MSKRVYTRRPLADRFWEKVEKTDYCWNWTGALSDNGYGKIFIGGSGPRSDSSHCVSYRWAKGEIPDGMEVDHLCRNRKCCNPDHLEAVPHRVNVLRSEAPNVLLFMANKCINGHELSEDNVVYIREKRRGLVARCKTCRYASTEAFRKRNTKTALGLPKLNNKGGRNGMSKTTDEEVARILTEFFENPTTVQVVAARTGIGESIVSAIIHNRRWLHVLPEIRESVHQLAMMKGREATTAAMRGRKKVKST